MIGFTLRSAGNQVIEASDGRDGLAKLSTDVQLVITDLNMPNMDGIEMIRQVRAGSKNKYVPIIVLTTESLPAKKQEAKKAGATGWIVKPFTPEQLLAVVKSVLG